MVIGLFLQKLEFSCIKDPPETLHQTIISSIEIKFFSITKMQVDLKKFLVILIKGPENRVLKSQTDNKTPGSKQYFCKESY